MARRQIQSALGLGQGDDLPPPAESGELLHVLVEDAAPKIQGSAVPPDHEVLEHRETSVAMTRSLTGV